MKFGRIIAISRYRFWIYELGPYALGAFAATPDLTALLHWRVLSFALFFLFSANLYIYGINDMFDYETDIKNPRKVNYEALVKPEEWKSLSWWIVAVVVPFLLFLPFHNKGAIISMVLFFFFAGFYSAKPIRAKAKPFFDSIFSAGHYVATGAFSYYLLGGVGVPVYPLLAAMAWSIAMHAYSAVPDIESDRSAALPTIATTLQKQKTLVLCLLLYIVSGILLYPYVGVVSLILMFVYAVLMIASLRIQTDEKLLHLYTYFPYINACSGMVIFFSILLSRFPL